MSDLKQVRPEKVSVVAEVRERLASTEAVVLTEYRGLNVPALAELRRALREDGGDYKIYKNTLVLLAVRELELDLEDLLVGPVALAFVGKRQDGTDGDAVSVAKALHDFAEDHHQLLVRGGLLDGKRLGVEEIENLAQIAPREVLLAQFAALIQAPIQQLAFLLKALPQNLAYALQALVDETEAEVVDETEAEAEDMEEG